MAQSLWRESVTRLNKYVPGKPIEEVKKEYGLEQVIRLASNENPYGPSQKAVQAMLEALHDIHIYPEPSCNGLREKLAERYGIDSEQIVVGNGADHIIRLIGAAYLNPGDEVIYCTPTFPIYRMITLLMGGVPIEIPVTEEYVFDLEAILDKVNRKTKLIFICNPNNPTGTIVKPDDFKEFLIQLPGNVIVAIDEAYVEYVPDNQKIVGIDLINEGYPVILIRTFSKLYGLAGARIGYMMARKEFILPVQTVREVFAVNRIAHVGAIASLDDEEYKKFIINMNREEMQKLERNLKLLGCDVYPSYANFLFVNFKQDSQQIFHKLMKQGIIIRPCGPWGLNTFARITIGTPEQNLKLIEAMQKLFLN